MGNLQDSTVPLIEAFAGLSRKAAGSQGSALSRTPQSAKSPLIPVFDRNQPKQKQKRDPQVAQFFAHKVRS